jgi:hypothetical protein
MPIIRINNSAHVQTEKQMLQWQKHKEGNALKA